jgi:hypothetical protein
MIPVRCRERGRVLLVEPWKIRKGIAREWKVRTVADIAATASLCRSIFVQFLKILFIYAYLVDIESQEIDI